MKIKQKVRKGQIWVDKKTGNLLKVLSKHHDIYWNCVLVASQVSHHMTPWALNKYFILVKE